MLQIKYQQLRDYIKDGDVIACKGTWLFSKLIRWYTGEEVSHVGLALWLKIGSEKDHRLCMIESMEGYGVRIIPISHALIDYDNNGGFMLWYPLDEDIIDREKVIGYALKHWLNKYPGIRQFIVAISPRLQWLHRLLGIPIDVYRYREHCSELVTRSLMAGSKDDDSKDESSKDDGSKDDGSKEKNEKVFCIKDPSVTTPGDVTRFSCLRDGWIIKPY